LLVVTSLFKARTTSREVKLKLVEFLYFYLMPEIPTPRMATSTSASNTAVLGGRGRELVAAFDRRRETVAGSDGAGKIGSQTRTTEEKQKLLGKYLSNVQDLVEDLKEGGGLFGGNM
jgi:Cell division control protein 14, SIN component